MRRTLPGDPVGSKFVASQDVPGYPTLCAPTTSKSGPARDARRTRPPSPRDSVACVSAWVTAGSEGLTRTGKVLRALAPHKLEATCPSRTAPSNNGFLMDIFF